MSGRTWLLLVVLVGVLAVPALLGSSECRAADVGIQVTQVKAGNEGTDSVDPALGDLGAKLKEKYRYRNFKLIGSTSRSAAEGGSANYALANGMSLTIKVVSVKGTTAELSVSITQGGAPVTSFTVKVLSGATFLANVPWGKDILILAIRPSM